MSGKTPSEDAAETSSPPVLRVISGNPTPEEVAAVTVVLTALSGAAQTAPAPALTGGWADPSRRLRRPPAPGHGAWQASARR